MIYASLPLVFSTEVKGVRCMTFPKLPAWGFPQQLKTWMEGDTGRASLSLLLEINGLHLLKFVSFPSSITRTAPREHFNVDRARTMSKLD